MLDAKYPFVLPPLPYEETSLEPYITAETLHYHYGKHFQTYVNNLNNALEKYPQMHNLTLKEILSDDFNDLPQSDSNAIMNNAGGVYNHYLYFNNLAPAKENNKPSKELMEKIIETFGSFDKFKEDFEKKALAVFGSGWTYLVKTKSGQLDIVNLKNQDTLVAEGMHPIILFDVWEHAYYIQYQNLRAKYAKELWNIIKFLEKNA